VDEKYIDVLDDDEGDHIDELVGDVYQGKKYGPEVLYNNPNCIYIDLNVSTKNISVYNSDEMEKNNIIIRR
jgi:hypothetical protein